jgi:hypothetical protein
MTGYFKGAFGCGLTDISTPIRSISCASAL